MKATVWTSGHNEHRPKCIFIGDIASVPRVGDYVVVRDGFAASTVKSVIFDLAKGEIEITISDSDPENEYGPCLYSQNLSSKEAR